MGNQNNNQQIVCWINKHTGARISGYATRVGINVSDSALGNYARQNENVGYGRGVGAGFFLGCLVSLATAAIITVVSKKKKKDAHQEEKGE